MIKKFFAICGIVLTLNLATAPILAPLALAQGAPSNNTGGNLTTGGTSINGYTLGGESATGLSTSDFTLGAGGSAGGSTTGGSSSSGGGAGNVVINAGTGIAATCGAGLLTQAVGYGIGLIKSGVLGTASVIATKAAAVVSVPEVPLAGPVTETAPSAAIQVTTMATFWETLQEKFRVYCLNPAMKQIAIAIIRGIRDQILTYINTGNFGKSTFITNFQFDAQQTAKNATRLFLSKISGLDFCNYYPPPGVDLNFELSVRLGLECTYQQSTSDYLKGLDNPGSLPYYAQARLLLPQNDPLMVEMQLRQKLAGEVASAVEARQNQVVSGKGFIGMEKCVEEKVVVAGGYFHSASGERCTTGADFALGDCVSQAAQTVCSKTEIVTPGSYVADIATEPIKSQMRELELIDEFGEIQGAITAIIDAFIKKTVNDGLSKAGL